MYFITEIEDKLPVLTSEVLISGLVCDRRISSIPIWRRYGIRVLTDNVVVWICRSTAKHYRDIVGSIIRCSEMEVKLGTADDGWNGEESRYRGCSVTFQLRNEESSLYAVNHRLNSFFPFIPAMAKSKYPIDI